ncbi:MAG: hypothetical protein QM538_03810 [Methylacidiphilales bacterium]|nr:hypothetical protein [Candidatus Methylacidiphilales bacterium]
MRIGVLETGRSSDQKVIDQYGDYPIMFERLLSGLMPKATFETFRVVNNIFPESHTACDAWIITGSRHCALDDYYWVHVVKDLVRKSYVQKVKLLGICFGHQVIAQALGGIVTPSVGWGIGIHEYSIINQPTFFNYRQPTLKIPVYHNDQVTVTPPDCQIIGTSEFCKHAILHYPGHAFTTQAHPEMTKAYIQVLINRDRGKTLSEESAKLFEATLQKEVDSQHFAESMVAFLSS